MNNNKLKIALFISAILNVVIICCFFSNLFASEEVSEDINNSEVFTNETVEEETTTSLTSIIMEETGEITTENMLDGEINMEHLNGWIEQRENAQMFYGSWKIEDLVAPDYALPSRYSRFDDNGNYIGLEYYKLIGKYLTIEKDYIQCDEKKYYYAYKPNIVVYPLDTIQEQGNSPFYLYNYKSLGLNSDTYSIVYFMLLDNLDIHYEFPTGRDILVSDLEEICIKDKDTMYISNGDLMFLMKRVAD